MARTRTSFKKNDPRTKELAAIAGKTPKRPRFERRIQEWLDSKTEKGEVREPEILKIIWEMIQKKNLNAIREIWDRAYGKPRQALEVTGEEGGPVETIVHFVVEGKEK